MRRVCFVLLLLATATTANAQMRSSASPEVIGAMEKLSMMVGDWEGTSTTRVAPGSEHTTTVRESAEWAVGGELLVVRGHGTMEIEGQEQVIHDAFGVIAWDAAADAYRMRSYRAGQGWVEAEVSLDGSRVSWTLESPAGPIEFTADFGENGRWIETGRMRRGNEWVSFLRMELDRVE